MEEFVDFKFQKIRFLKLLGTMPKANQKVINQAFKLMTKAHLGQKRDEGGPYIIHCLRIASCLIEELGIKDHEIISATLLHDTVEDTNLKLQEIIEKLGVRVGEIVNKLTRKKEDREMKENKYERKYRKFLEIMKMDKEIRTIKACDWLDNMRSWPYIPKTHPARKKFKRWFYEVKTMYIPLAQTVDKRVVNKMIKAFAIAKKNSRHYSI